MAIPAKNTKEAIILAIDIGKNSSQQDSDGKTYFEKSIYYASRILKRKIFTESGDHVALILFGSYHTINHLSSQGSCYGNIETISYLGVATWDLFNRLNSISSTNNTHSDWISTFVLAADMLKKKNENEFFTGLHIVMFSNLATDISFSNIDIIAACLKMENINLTIIGKDCEAASRDPAFDVFIKKTEATAVNFDLIAPKLSYYKQKEVTEKSWDAPLKFGEVFKIYVSGYEKIDVTTKSSNWLFSKNYDKEYSTAAMKKHPNKNGDKMEVNKIELPIDNLHPDNEIVPAINLHIDECTYMVHSKNCLQVLGFTKTTNTQSSFLIDGGSYIFKPHKKDIIAFNAIFDSMVQREEVMLVRKVGVFINLLNIGALFPQEEDNEKFFVFVNLPYVDEKYKYILPSIDPIESRLKEKIAYPKSTAAIDKHIDGNKFVMPEKKYDAELQSLYNCIIQAMLKKIIPEKIQCLINPPKSITENTVPPSKEFTKMFSREQEVSENCAAKDNNTIQFVHDKKLNVSTKLIKPPISIKESAGPALEAFLKKYSFRQEVSENSSVDDNDTIKFARDEKLEVSKQCVITTLDPIEDFNKLLKNGFDTTIVCKKMQYAILNLIEFSSSLEDLKKPIATLKTLREYYINNNDVKSYNNFMYLVKDAVLISGKQDMWSKFINSGIGLVTNQEIDASDISQESSEEFMKLSEDFDLDFIIDDDNPLKEFL